MGGHGTWAFMGQRVLGSWSDSRASALTDGNRYQQGRFTKYADCLGHATGGRWIGSSGHLLEGATAAWNWLRQRPRALGVVIGVMEPGAFESVVVSGRLVKRHGDRHSDSQDIIYE